MKNIVIKERSKSHGGFKFHWRLSRNMTKINVKQKSILNQLQGNIVSLWSSAIQNNSVFTICFESQTNCITYTCNWVSSLNIKKNKWYLICPAHPFYNFFRMKCIIGNISYLPILFESRYLQSQISDLIALKFSSKKLIRIII